MIVADPDFAVSARFSADEAALVRMKMGPYSLYAFSRNSWLQDVAAHSDPPDVAAILAPQARIVDFTGYYLSGPPNPAYQGNSADLARSSVRDVSWDEKQVEFLPSAVEDWRPWPWPPGLEPYILGIHGSPGGSAFSGPDMREAAAPWAVGSWIRRIASLKIAVRPLVDPVVLMSCHAAPSGQAMADDTGRLVWGPTGDISLGAEPISLADASAGVRARVSLYPTADGRPGRFRSSYPRGPAGDLIRHAYRERLRKADINWMAEQFAPSAAIAPAAIQPRQVKGHGRFFGWSFYDERDWNSRRAAFRPFRIGSAYVTWTPSDVYQPGTPRQLDPQTGTIAEQAEPWHISAKATLPFDTGDVLFAAGYFARGHFLVAGPDEDVTYLENPLEFGLRLRREHEAATQAGQIGGRALPRPVMLLTDHEPVPQWAARLVARGLEADVITVSLPATMFLDDHPAAGIPETRVALIPGSSDTGTPEWTRTTPGGASATLTAPTPSDPERQLRRLAEPYVPVPGSRPAVFPAPGPARPRDLAQVRHALEAGTGLTPEALQPGRQVTTASVLAVRRPAGIDFVSPRGQGQWSSELASLQTDGGFELLEINGEYEPGTPAPIDPVTGQPTDTAALMLAGSCRALPGDATDNPLYVLADYYGGYFLLSVKPAAGKTITIRADSPRDFGRRIQAELLPAWREPGQAPAASRPVVLLARHRPVPPQAAAALAAELNASSGVYTPSLPATTYTRTHGAAATTAVLALIQLPGHAEEPYWTLTTPAGLTSRIGAPPLHHDIRPQTATPAGDSAPGPVTRQRPVAWNRAGNSVQPSPAGRDQTAGTATAPGAPRDSAAHLQRRPQPGAPDSQPKTGERRPEGGLRLSEGRRGEARAGSRPAGSADDAAAGHDGVMGQLRAVNADFGSGGEAATNCVIAAIAMDMYLVEGSDQVRFVASHASPLPETDLANYQRQVREAGDDHPAEWYLVTGLESVRTVMTAAGPGARGLVLVRPADGRQVRHVFNVHRDSRGRVWLLDGQRGEEADPVADHGPGQLVFIPLTHGIGVPEGAAGTQPDETGLTGTTSRQPESRDIVDYWAEESARPGARRSAPLTEVDRVVERWKAERDHAAQSPMRALILLNDILNALGAWRESKAGKPSARDGAARRLEAGIRELRNEYKRLHVPTGTALEELEAQYFPPHLPLGDQHRNDTAVVPHVDGEAYFGAVAEVLDTLGSPGDRLYIASWNLEAALRLRDRPGEPDLGTRIRTLAGQGVDVRVIIAVPRHSLSPLDKPVHQWPTAFRYPIAAALSRYINVNMGSVHVLRAPSGRDVSPLDGRVLLDWGGGLDSRHEKTVIAYHEGSGQLHAFLGGIDFGPWQMASPGHRGAPGENFHHDIGVHLQGGAAEAALENFWTRWQETATLPSRQYHFRGQSGQFNPRVEPAPAVLRPEPAPLPAQLPQAARLGAGIRVWRSYAGDRVTPMPLAADFQRVGWETLPRGGVREVSAGLNAAIDAARRYVYVEDQTLNPGRLLELYSHHKILFPAFARALRRGVKVVFVTQGFPGPGLPNTDATPDTSAEIRSLIRDRVTTEQWRNFALFTVADTKVHSKLVLVDDEFAAMGSANAWDRSMTGDESEVTAAIVHPGGESSLAADLRVRLWREHLRLTGSDTDLRDLDTALGLLNPAWSDGRAAPDTALRPTRGTAAHGIRGLDRRPR